MIDGDLHDKTKPVNHHCPYCNEPFCAMCLAPAHKGKKRARPSSLRPAQSVRAIQSLSGPESGGRGNQKKGIFPKLSTHSYLVMVGNNCDKRQDKMFENLADKWKWRACPSCRQMVEKISGTTTLSSIRPFFFLSLQCCKLEHHSSFKPFCWCLGVGTHVFVTFFFFFWGGGYLE
jgi:hypothetical protein